MNVKSDKPWLAGKPKNTECVYDGQDLWEVACEYFEWCFNNPVIEERYDRKGISQTVDLPRAFTVDGFLVFAGLSKRKWDKYCYEDSISEFIAGNILAIIRNQKFENAAVRKMDPAIIAKELGLANRSVTTTTTKSLFDLMDDAPKIHQQTNLKA